MTPPMTDHPAPPPAPSAYVAPALTPLGTVSTVTAGPDGARTLDGLVGDDGGFRRMDEPTS